jgi:hypothetical protein
MDLQFLQGLFQPFEEFFFKLGHFVVSEPNGFLREI